MSSPSINIITQVLKNCPIDFTECPHGLDTACVVKLTTDCFSRMNTNVVAAAAGIQTGGGSGLNFDSIVPYLVANGVRVLKSTTLVPVGIINTVSDRRLKLGFDEQVSVGKVLNTGQIAEINSVLTRKPKNY